MATGPAEYAHWNNLPPYSEAVLTSPEDQTSPGPATVSSVDEDMAQWRSRTQAVPVDIPSTGVRRTSIGRGLPPVPPKRRSLSVDSFPSPVPGSNGVVGASSASPWSPPSVPTRPSTSSTSRVEANHPDRKKYGILLMGATGAGKSSFIAAATGAPVQIGHTLEPCTSEPSAFELVCRDGTQVSLIDTPGFNDLSRPDMDVLDSIVAFIEYMKFKIIAVIYLHRIVDKKVTGSARLNLRMLRALCGEHYFQNVVLATSMWSSMSVEAQEATANREIELNNSPEFWADMIEKGAKYVRWDDRLDRHVSNARDVVEKCRSKKDAPLLQILLERQKGADLEDTTAGRILTEELRKRQEKERRALEAEQEEMRDLQQAAARLRQAHQEAQSDALLAAEHAAAAVRAHHSSERRPSPSRPEPLSNGALDARDPPRRSVHGSTSRSESYPQRRSYHEEHQRPARVRITQEYEEYEVFEEDHRGPLQAQTMRRPAQNRRPGGNNFVMHTLQYFAGAPRR